MVFCNGYSCKIKQENLNKQINFCFEVLLSFIFVLVEGLVVVVVVVTIQLMAFPVIC